MAGEAAETVVYEQDTTDFAAMSEDDLSSYLSGDGAARQEEKPEPTPEPEPEPAAEDTPAEPEPPKVPTAEEIRAEVEAKFAKQLQDKELFIQRQAAEIGQLRKATAPPPQPDVPNILDDPVQAVNQIITHRDTLVFQQRMDNQNAVRQVVPDIDKHIGAIEQLAMADGYSEHDIALFRQDPYLYSTPQVLINYARRAESIAKQAELQAIIAEKEKAIAELQKKPDELLKKVEKAAKETPGLTGKAGEASGKIEVTSPAQFAHMTDAQLAQWMKENP